MVDKIRVLLSASLFALAALAVGSYYGFLRGPWDGTVAIGGMTWYDLAPFYNIHFIYRNAFIVSLVFLITSSLKKNLITGASSIFCAVMLGALYVIAYSVKAPWINDTGEYISFARETVWFDITGV